jgi:hypothetical protein
MLQVMSRKNNVVHSENQLTLPTNKYSLSVRNIQFLNTNLMTFIVIIL